MRALGPASAMMLAVWMASGVTAIPKRSGHQVSKKLELFFFFCLRDAFRDEDVRRFSRTGVVATGMGREYSRRDCAGHEKLDRKGGREPRQYRILTFYLEGGTIAPKVQRKSRRFQKIVSGHKKSLSKGAGSGLN